MTSIQIARIVKPHGLAGEVGVLPHQATSTLLRSGSVLEIDLAEGGRRQLTVQAVRPKGRGWLVKFAEVEDRTAAEQLRGASISVQREQLPSLGQGEAYLSDLVNARVVGPDGKEVGRVVEVIVYPSVDALVVERADGSRAELPLLDEWLERVDTRDGIVVLGSLEGLIE